MIKPLNDEQLRAFKVSVDRAGHAGHWNKDQVSSLIATIDDLKTQLAQANKRTVEADKALADFNPYLSC